MKIKYFKNFMSFVLPTSVFSSLETLDPELIDVEVYDPVGHQWKTMGFTETATGGVFVELNSKLLIAEVQFNERILPGSVRDEQVLIRVKEMEKRLENPITRKLYAEIKDEVTVEMLPKAFIRRSCVPVVFRRLNDRVSQLFVFTSSPKRCDDVFELMFDVFEKANIENFIPKPAVDIPAIPAVLEAVATSDQTGIYESITPGNTIVLKGADKRTVRLKDIEDEERRVDGLSIGEILHSGYEVSELGLRFHDTYGEIVSEVTLNDKGVFKKATMSDVFIEENKVSENDYSMLYLTVENCAYMLDQFNRADDNLKSDEL